MLHYSNQVQDELRQVRKLKTGSSDLTEAKQLHDEIKASAMFQVNSALDRKDDPFLMLKTIDESLNNAQKTATGRKTNRHEVTFFQAAFDRLSGELLRRLRLMVLSLTASRTHLGPCEIRQPHRT